MPCKKLNHFIGLDINQKLIDIKITSVSIQIKNP
jgi:hypothetical protein